MMQQPIIWRLRKRILKKLKFSLTCFEAELAVGSEVFSPYVQFGEEFGEAEEEDICEEDEDEGGEDEWEGEGGEGSRGEEGHVLGG